MAGSPTVTSVLSVLRKTVKFLTVFFSTILLSSKLMLTHWMLSMLPLYRSKYSCWLNGDVRLSPSEDHVH